MVFDLSTGKLIHHHRPGRPNCVAIDGRHVAFGTNQNQIVVYELNTGKRVFYRTELDAIHSISVGGSMVVAGDRNGTVHIDDFHLNKLFSRRRWHSDRVYSIAIAPAAKSILSAGKDGRLQTWTSYAELKNQNLAIGDVAHEIAMTADGLKSWDPANSLLRVDEQTIS